MLGQLNPALRETKQTLKARPSLWLQALVLLLIAITTLAIYDASTIVFYPQMNKLSCQADTILVMGAAQYNGVPSPAFQRRLDKALDLYKQGCGSSLIVTGGAQVGDNYSEGITGAAYLYGFGVPKKDLLSETKSTTSYENLAFSKALSGERNLTIVTDDLHAYRTSYLAKRLGYSSELATVHAPYRRWSYGFSEFMKITAHRFGLIR